MVVLVGCGAFVNDINATCKGERDSQAESQPQDAVSVTKAVPRGVGVRLHIPMEKPGNKRNAGAEGDQCLMWMDGNQSADRREPIEDQPAKDGTRGLCQHLPREVSVHVLQRSRVTS